MKELPIIFSGLMVRAILEGRKTQTRRVVKPQPVPDPARAEAWFDEKWVWTSNSGKVGIFKPQLAACPYGTVGDRLWVRETWASLGVEGRGTVTVYKADGDTDYEETPKWKPSIYMPRWASRITLEVTAVRVERLQDISEEDCISEGLEKCNCTEGCERCAFSWQEEYQALWDSINGKKYPWSSNPWVWAITFKRIKP